jgi:hypothetical protein
MSAWRLLSNVKGPEGIAVLPETRSILLSWTCIYGEETVSPKQIYKAHQAEF